MYILGTYKSHSTYIVHIHIYNMYVCMFVCVCVCRCFFCLFPVFAALPKLWQNYETLSKKEHKNKNQSNRNNICTYVRMYLYYECEYACISWTARQAWHSHARAATALPPPHTLSHIVWRWRAVVALPDVLARPSELIALQASERGRGAERGARERGAHSQLRCGTTLSEPAKQHETREFQSQLGDNVVAVIVARVTQPILIYAKRTHTHTQTYKSTTINSFIRVSCSHILSP